MPLKKLLPLVFAFYGSVLMAQDSDPQNSLAIIAGPNWSYRFDGGRILNADFYSRTGFSTGLDYTLLLDNHWQLKAAFRYNILTYKVEGIGANYEAEDNTWQLLVGMRWMSKPKPWRWYVDVETGMTGFIVSDEEPGVANIRPTLGAGFGVAWQPPERKTAVFVQPAARYIFHNVFSDISTLTLRYLVPVVEAGARRYF